MKNIALTLASLSLALAHAPQALAQTHCSSDGAPKPVALFERFISADCEACWGDAATPALCAILALCLPVCCLLTSTPCFAPGCA